MRIVTLNVRYATADDGANSWPYRREACFEVLRSLNPDVLCLQEALDAQADEIRNVLGDYTRYGVGRDDGIVAGEHATILVRDQPVLEEGTFWLSEKPEEPGSLGWGAKHPRVCTWVRFDRLRVFNVHLDHEASKARLNGVRLILKKIGDDPAVLCGDFNAEPTEAPILLILESGFTSFVDEGTTYHGYGTGHNQIDYIFGRGVGAARRAGVVRTAPGGHYPSDHWPLVVDLDLASS